MQRGGVQKLEQHNVYIDTYDLFHMQVGIKDSNSSSCL